MTRETFSFHTFLYIFFVDFFFLNRVLLVNRLGTFNEVDGIPDGWAEGEKVRERGAAGRTSYETIGHLR